MDTDLEFYIKPYKGSKECINQLITEISAALSREEEEGKPLYNMVFNCNIIEKECQLIIHRLTGESELTTINYPLSDGLFLLDIPGHLFKDIAPTIFFHALISHPVKKALAKLKKGENFTILLPKPYYEIQERRQAVAYEDFFEISAKLKSYI